MRDMERLWQELGLRVLETLVAAGAPADTAKALCSIVQQHADVACEVQASGRLGGSAAFERAAASMPWSAQTALGSDDAAARLLLAGQEPLQPEDLARLVKIFERVLALSSQANPYQRVVHQTNNLLASLLANLDYVDVLLSDQPAAGPILAESTAQERSDFFLALSHARVAAQRLVETLKGAEPGTPPEKSGTPAGRDKRNES